MKLQLGGLHHSAGGDDYSASYDVLWGQRNLRHVVAQRRDNQRWQYGRPRSADGITVLNSDGSTYDSAADALAALQSMLVARVYSGMITEDGRARYLTVCPRGHEAGQHYFVDEWKEKLNDGTALFSCFQCDEHWRPTDADRLAILAAFHEREEAAAHLL
jgi:hypothetical protein